MTQTETSPEYLIEALEAAERRLDFVRDWIEDECHHVGEMRTTKMEQISRTLRIVRDAISKAKGA